jgi:hypothetical protein|tara:strand:+ start:1460 stop:2692 length:1233 start_codon:yes stop_codon:yes gene_type:complete
MAEMKGTDVVADKEFTDDELGSMVNKLYGDSETKGVENEPQPEEAKIVDPIAEPTEPIKKEDIHVDSPELPPGFDPASENIKQDVKETIDLDDKTIDEAIENAPNDSYKNNIVAMRKSLQSKKEELEKQTSLLNQLKEKGLLTDDNQITQLEDSKEMMEKLNDAYDKLGKYDLMADPRFISKYQQPIKSHLETITSMLVDAVPEDDKANLPATVNQMVALKPVERAKFMQDNLPEELRLAVVPYFARIDEIVMERNVALQNHRETQKDIKERATTEDAIRTKAYKEAVKSKTSKDLIADGFKIFERKEGNDEYNQFVDSIYSKADMVFESEDNETQAKAMLLGVAAPVYRGMYEATEAKLREALKEIENLKGARASFNGSNTTKNDEGNKKALQSNKGIAQMLGKDLSLL